MNKLERLPKDYTFGIELEFTGGLSYYETQSHIEALINKGLIREGWKVHFDRSVIDENGLGAEIVSPVLHDDEETEREIKIITDFIKENGGVMSDKCGGHVHYGLQCLGTNIEHIKNFFKLYSIFEPLLYKLSTGDLDYVRPGCRDYAKPVQKRLTPVIDSKISSMSDLMAILMANIGANATHYGAYRYYGLNIQRITEAIREKPDDMDLEEFLLKIFNGEEVIDKDGNALSPTIELRFRNASSDPEEILNGIRMGGQLFVAAKRDDLKDNEVIPTLYRHLKKLPSYVFDMVLSSDRTNPRYRDCKTDEEILEKKFKLSEYGNGLIDESTFNCLFSILYPNMTKEEVRKLFIYYAKKIGMNIIEAEEKKEERSRYSLTAFPRALKTFIKYYLSNKDPLISYQDILIKAENNRKPMVVNMDLRGLRNFILRHDIDIFNDNFRYKTDKEIYNTWKNDNKEIYNTWKNAKEAYQKCLIFPALMTA